MPRSICAPLEASRDICDLAGPPSNSTRLRTSKTKIVEERAAAAESSRRCALSATGPEAAEHKAAAERAQRYAATQSKRLRRAGCERSRQKIYQEVAEAHRVGSISDREWMAWAADNPECLAHERRGRSPERKKPVDDAVQLMMWKDFGLTEWSFAKGEKKEDERVRDEVVYCGPKGETVASDYQAPTLRAPESGPKFVERQGVLSRAMGFFEEWVRKVKYYSCAWIRKKEIDDP